MRDLSFRGTRLLQHVVIGVLAFSLGAAALAQAVTPGGLQGVFRLADATDETHLAAVDASGNLAVEVNNLRTVQLLERSHRSDEDGFHFFDWIDVSAHKTVRITARWHDACAPAPVITVVQASASGDYDGLPLSSDTMTCGGIVSHVFDVPATWILIHTQGGGPGETIDITVYGHP
jgi:hypothetical protein